jgi:hypothetical protein
MHPSIPHNSQFFTDSGTRYPRDYAQKATELINKAQTDAPPGVKVTVRTADTVMPTAGGRVGRGSADGGPTAATNTEPATDDSGAGAAAAGAPSRGDFIDLCFFHYPYLTGIKAGKLRIQSKQYIYVICVPEIDCPFSTVRT